MAHLVITLYDPETNEVVKEYTRTFVPWKLLKRAVKLSKSIGSFNVDDLSEDAGGRWSIIHGMSGLQWS